MVDLQIFGVGVKVTRTIDKMAVDVVQKDVVQRPVACSTLPWPKAISPHLDSVSYLPRTFEHGTLRLLKPFASNF